MATSKTTKIYLIISGTTFFIIGMSLSIIPVIFKNILGMNLLGKTSILNDYSAFGILVSCIGIYAVIASQKKNILGTAIVFIPIFFLALAIGRIISIGLHGVPTEGLLVAGLLEFIFGIVGLWICFTDLKKRAVNNPS